MHTCFLCLIILRNGQKENFQAVKICKYGHLILHHESILQNLLWTRVIESVFQRLEIEVKTGCLILNYSGYDAQETHFSATSDA